MVLSSPLIQTTSHQILCFLGFSVLHPPSVRLIQENQRTSCQTDRRFLPFKLDILIHSSRRSSYPSLVRSTLLSTFTPTDFPPSIAGPLFLRGVVLILPSFYLSSIWPLFSSPFTHFPWISPPPPPPPLDLPLPLFVPAVPPSRSANYPCIKIYADSLMNPDPLNASWAHSCGWGQLFPTCDISMLSFIGRLEINHQAGGGRCATA